MKSHRSYQGIPLPTGVAVVLHSAHGKIQGIAVMAYHGGRGKQGAPRRQKTKRFNPMNFPSLHHCLRAAAEWRDHARPASPKTLNLQS